MPYKEKISGVYIILNKINGKFYIGSSVNIKSRWSLHKKQLRENSHHSKYLQRSWNKYGEENFLFSIMEECEREECLNIENKWLNFHNTSNIEYGYNTVKEAHNTLGYKHTAETRLKLKQLHKDRIEKMTLEEFAEYKSVLSNARKGKVLSEKHSLALRKGLKRSGWLSSEKKKEMTKKTNFEKISKPILQYSLEGELLNEFKNARLAMEYLGLPLRKTSNLNRAASTKEASKNRKTSFGYIWKYKNEIQ